MINRLMQKRDRQEGFTLIEMLIVVIILGILAAVVVFGVSTFRKDSVKSACETDLQSVETAAEAYRTKTGDYPVTDATFDPDHTPLTVLLDADYLKEEPDNNEYTISLASGTGNASASPTCDTAGS